MLDLMNPVFWGGVTDDVPDALSFVVVTDTIPNTEHISNTQSVTGISGVQDVLVSGGTVSINGGPFVTSGTVINGDSITLKSTASSNFNTSKQVLLSVGDYDTSWEIQTKVKDISPNSFSVLNYTGVSTSFSVLYRNIPVSGLEPNTEIYCEPINCEMQFYRYEPPGNVEWLNNGAMVPTDGDGTLRVGYKVIAPSALSSSKTYGLRVGDLTATGTITTYDINLNHIGSVMFNRGPTYLYNINGGTYSPPQMQFDLSLSSEVPDTLEIEHNNTTDSSFALRSQIQFDANLDGSFNNTSETFTSVIGDKRVNIIIDDEYTFSLGYARKQIKFNVGAVNGDKKEVIAQYGTLAHIQHQGDGIIQVNGPGMYAVPCVLKNMQGGNISIDRSFYGTEIYISKTGNTSDTTFGITYNNVTDGQDLIFYFLCDVSQSEYDENLGTDKEKTVGIELSRDGQPYSEIYFGFSQYDYISKPIFRYV